MAMLPNGPALELTGVSKYYGKFPAVRDLDLTIPRGSTYGVLGPNGAGKTTTIRMALRILEPDTGSIAILGQPLSPEGLDRVGYLPGERGIYRRMKVRDLLVFLAELKGMRGRDAKPEIDRWLERMDLGAWADKKVQDLSKGMQQKVQFIGSVLHEPELIVLDEPFSGLDPINQQVLREIVVELKRANRTIIFSTHIIEHAERICDHVCIIAQGRGRQGPAAQAGAWRRLRRDRFRAPRHRCRAGAGCAADGRRCAPARDGRRSRISAGRRPAGPAGSPGEPGNPPASVRVHRAVAGGDLPRVRCVSRAASGHRRGGARPCLEHSLSSSASSRKW